MSQQKDEQFFSTTKRGEVLEWKELLNNEKESVRKDAVKKVNLFIKNLN